MTTRRLLLNFLVSMLLVGVAQAAPVSLSRATAIAETFLTNSAPVVPGLKRVPARPRLARVAAPQSAYYVFENEAGGFVIVSGDDVAYPILGYSNDSASDTLYMPSNVKAWLEGYAADIQTALDNGLQQSDEVKRAWENLESYSNAAVIVSPLILTRWNQDPYYNDMCPMDNSRNERTVVGCVATAMAQVLKYWEYPITGNGSHSYTHTHGVQSANFAKTTYDWANMPLELTSTSSDIQKAAVAQLMYHCGVSVEMDYGVASTGGSGAFTISSKSNSTHCAEYALREYWGYKPTLQGLQKSKYSDKDWKTMLKNDLKAGRPIIYSGYGDGGHCFVCDGYNEDEYFHFNWGWGGLYDGFFLLNALAPGTGGTGSGGGTYNNDQQAIFGLEPLKSLDNDEATKDLQLASTISISSSEIAYKEGFSVSASVKNTGSANFDGELGLALYDSGLELLTVMDAKSTIIAAGGTADCTFGTEGWSELVAGLYYAAIYSRNGNEDWTSIGKGTYRNMVQFRINTDPCAGNKVYECDFESDLLGWTFAKAPGINSGFAVGSAMKYQGEKALYISPDGGATAGYTQDNDRGYVSVAYKKIYLEAGRYSRLWNYYQSGLKYLDIDQDYCKVAIVPETNSIIPLDYYESSPTFMTGNISSQTYSNNYDYWTSSSSDFTVTNSGNYYLVFSFIASDKRADNIGIVVDNISITKKEELKYGETLEGVQFEWTGGYEKYAIEWYCYCDYIYKKDTVVTNKYLIPYTALREAVYNTTMFRFYVTPICENGNKGNQQTTTFNVKTDPFPTDTCPAVPVNLKAENTNTGVRFTWNGNAGIYDVKFGTSSNGCTFIDAVENINDTICFVPYSLLEEKSTYFFVRGLCTNDTSIWKRISLTVKGPDACSSSELCYAKPCNLYAQNINEGIMLTWDGNAQQYEIECRSEDEYYRRGNIYEYNDSNYVRFMAYDSLYVIPYNLLPDTLYHFRVRAICENDTSFWTDYISAYNINFGEYCIPFYDLCGPNTLCTYGGYSSPYSNKKTLDYRQKDWDQSYYRWSDYGYRYGVHQSYSGWKSTYYRSRHTICFEGETDPHCDNLLTTVPKGEKYSMRLGNWYNGEGESVTYTHTIDSGYPLILLLKYAVVLQDPSHTSAENPHFTLEILDENNQLLDSECWYADFAADKNATGWNNAVNAHEPTSEEFRNVVWKDWTTIGVNLSDLSKYGDRTIKIRLTTKDCTRGQHYGYAYFTLSCTTADMKGMSCGVRPEKFEVAEGFKYNWYLMDDPTKTTVCDSNVFIVQANDTNSYHVDMISLENEDCFYTLNAYTLPRLPRPQATFTHTPNSCVNEVTIRNTSYVYKKMLDGTEQKDGRIVIDSIFWDLGEYGTSSDLEPQLIVPNEGDTFQVSLRVVANGCSEEAEYTLNIPTIRDTVTYAHRYLCKGDTLYYSMKEYTTAGVYVDSLKRTCGCDSVDILTVEYLEPEYKYYFDTICAVEAPYTFFGKQYMQSGTYEEHIASSLGCDTIIHQLQLLVLDSLNIIVHDGMEHSRDCGEFVLPYTVQKGTMLGYTIDYSDDANANGFVDVTNDTARSVVSIVVPPTCDSKLYQATIYFHNGDCPALEVSIQFTITLFSKPESKAVFTPAPHDCINEVKITNQSAVYKYYNDSVKVQDPTQTIEAYAWDLGAYGQSTLAEPALIVPQQGDTFTVTLTTTYGAYTHTEEYLLEIPSILENDGYMYQYICQGEKFVYNGTEYSTPGQYVLDVVTSSIGCDSTSYLVIAYLEPEVVELYDTTCYNQLPYDFYGQSCYATDRYQHVVKAKAGCDSISYQLNLYVYEELKVTLNELSEICSGDPSFDVSYTTLSGSISGISVRFSEEAKALGFMDTTATVETNNMFTLDLPQDIRPDVYMAEVLFDNHGCEVINLPLAISVDYSNEVITQRWNDFLSVRQTAYTYYDGFTAYQWYCNGNLIEGATTSQLYKPEGLGENTYQVELVRATDGVKAISCPFIPTEQPNTTTLEVQPTITAKGAPIRVKAPNHGDMDIIGNVGVNMGTQYLQEGENTVTVPTVAGIYLLHLTTEDGNQYVQKIIVY